jgi:hypothetical protein
VFLDVFFQPANTAVQAVGSLFYRDRPLVGAGSGGHYSAASCIWSMLIFST